MLMREFCEGCDRWKGDCICSYRKPKETKKVKSILLFPDGNFAAIDDKGNQIAELQQRTACELIGEHARLLGWDIDHCEFGVNGDICGELRSAKEGIKQVRYFDDFKG